MKNPSMIPLGGGVEQPLLGRYQIERELGRGALGVAYLGKDPTLGRAAAVKTMAMAGELEAEGLQAVREIFRREAATARRLHHPHIVAILDAGEAHGLAYIAMELLQGTDLTPYIKPDNLLPLPQVMRIVARVAAALHYAHIHGVVHRDIKPSNIMYEPASDTVKVTDFGIAHCADWSRIKSGRLLGTPNYMSPEQLAGQEIEGRSDLYSLGVTLYQLVSGQLPFQGDSLPQLVIRISKSPHADIMTYNAKLPSCVAGIINKALAKHPAGRYQTGDEMARAIEVCADAMRGSCGRHAGCAAPRGMA